MVAVGFKDTLPSDLLEVDRRIRESGYGSYLVGGCVRDFFLGRTFTDYDLTTNAHPDAVAKVFPKVIPTGIKHGTVTVLMGEHSFEVTTYRKDGEYSDGRRPDRVTFSETLEEDLKRRDFTINALAYDIEKDVLIDEYQGRADLKSKTIRTIGEPRERFKEDALRMMRACRFASQLGFEIEEGTKKAIQALKENISLVSMERIRDELIKIIQSPIPSVGFEAMRETGLLDYVMPELLIGYGVQQNQYHAYDVYHHSLKVLDNVKNTDHRLRLAGIFHDIAKPIVMKHIPGKKEPVFYNHEIVGAGVAKKFMRRLKFSNEDIKLVAHLVRQHMFHYTADWTDGAVRRFINKIEKENLSLLFQLREADRLGSGTKGADCDELKELRRRVKQILEKDIALKVTDLSIGGNDLMEAFNLEPSKELGNILKALLEKVLDDPTLNKRETLLELAKKEIDGIDE